MSQITEFTVGQRWLSETEPELGLGIVVDVDFRTVAVAFRACEESRRYARSSAPLNRIVFAAGDTVRNRDEQEFTVTGVQDHQAVVTYQLAGSDQTALHLPETELSDRLLLNRPLDRLMSGQIDHYQWYALKK